jgi:uncharacterized protein involved in exopolysaccharide biosynthesis
MVESNAAMSRTIEDRMDVRSLVEIFIRRRWIILGVALPVILIALIGTLRSTQTFMARSTLMIEMASPSTPSFSRSTPNYDMVLSAAAELAMSAPVAREAGRALADSLPSLRRQMPEYFAEVETPEELGGVLLNGVGCSHVGESNLLSLSFSHPDPGFALLGAKALADAFVAFNISTKRNSPAVGYYDEQIAVTQAEIDSLMARRVAVLDSTGLLGMQADLRQSFNQIRGLESDYFMARSRREGLEAELNGLRQAIDEDPDFIPMVSMSQSGSMYRLQGELDTRVAKIAELQQTYTEDSSFIRREREQLDAIREELHRERGRFLRALEVKLAEAASVERSLHDAYQKQLADAQSYPKVQGEIETLDQRLSSLNKLMDNLQHKRGEVRMSANSDVRISDVLVIEDPVLDAPVGRGRKVLYLIVSIVLAVAMGLVAAFFVESNDHRIYDRRRAELYLEVPVLGSLPDTSGKTGY